jgi:hypothetical protein
VDPPPHPATNPKTTKRAHADTRGTMVTVSHFDILHPFSGASFPDRVGDASCVY